jgi:uncharacterized membrane protein (UPF0127 family)
MAHATVPVVRTFALFAWFATAAASCSTSSTSKRDDEPMTAPAVDPPRGTAPSAPSAKVYLTTPQGEVAVNVEVVATRPKIERGLMYREHMPPDDGMVFLLGDESDHTFWMHNTLIPLDMIFIRKDMTIAGIVQNAEPKTDTPRKVGETSLYVLEVNGGYCASHGVAANAKVRFENVQTR